MKYSVKSFIDAHYHHFNAATLKDAARAYDKSVSEGNVMLVTLAGAMSTAELGRSLAEMIRQDKVHAISCTGANLEEDVFNLVAHDHYKRIPNYRELSKEDEVSLLQQHFNRVTDTCIPEEAAMRHIEDKLLQLWQKADQAAEHFFPHEFIYQLVRSNHLKPQIDPKDSWILAAAEKKLPLFVPGWEDSTLGNFFAGHIIKGNLSSSRCLRPGIEYMIELASWYESTASENKGVGFFQIGGGIAGDFPICVVPMLHQDIGRTNVPLWNYFCQISDSTTSYGSYSGAVPNEKITWGKLAPDTPSFIIESDATIIAPLLFAYVLDW